jgi:hypothetical protein
MGPAIEFRFLEPEVGPPADGTHTHAKRALATPNEAKIQLVGRIALEKVIDVGRQLGGAVGATPGTIWGSPMIGHAKQHLIDVMGKVRNGVPRVLDAQHTEHIISITRKRKLRRVRQMSSHQRGDR